MNNIERYDQLALEGFGVMTDVPDIPPHFTLSFVQKMERFVGAPYGATIKMCAELLIDDVVRHVSDTICVVVADWVNVTVSFAGPIPAGRYGLRFMFMSTAGTWKPSIWTAAPEGWPAERIIGQGNP